MTRRQLREHIKALEFVDCEVCREIGKYAPTKGKTNGFHCKSCGTEYEVVPCNCCKPQGGK